MRRVVFIYFCLAGDFLVDFSVGLKEAPTLGSTESPRVLSKGNIHLLLRLHRCYHAAYKIILECFRCVQCLRSV